MPSVRFDIDFGDPQGTLEEMGCEDFTSAQEVIDALKKDGSRVARALEDWNLLDFGTVRVTWTPDKPAELESASIETVLKWFHENETTAEWSDWSPRSSDTETKDS